MENSVSVDYSVCESELMPTGYYDTNGFFVITGYCDKYGNYIEDNKKI